MAFFACMSTRLEAIEPPNPSTDEMEVILEMFSNGESEVEENDRFQQRSCVLNHDGNDKHGHFVHQPSLHPKITIYPLTTTRTNLSRVGQVYLLHLFRTDDPSGIFKRCCLLLSTMVVSYLISNHSEAWTDGFSHPITQTSSGTIADGRDTIVWSFPFGLSLNCAHAVGAHTAGRNSSDKHEDDTESHWGLTLSA